MSPAALGRAVRRHDGVAQLLGLAVEELRERFGVVVSEHPRVVNPAGWLFIAAAPRGAVIGGSFGSGLDGDEIDWETQVRMPWLLAPLIDGFDPDIEFCNILP